MSYGSVAKTFLDAFRWAASADVGRIRDRCERDGQPVVRDPVEWVLSKFPDGWTVNDFPYYPLIVVSPADVDLDVWLEGLGEGCSRVSGSLSVHLMHRGRLADFDALSDEVFTFLREYDWTRAGIYITRIRSELETRDVSVRPVKFYHRTWRVDFEVVE